MNYTLVPFFSFLVSNMMFYWFPYIFTSLYLFFPTFRLKYPNVHHIQVHPDEKSAQDFATDDYPEFTIHFEYWWVHTAHFFLSRTYSAARVPDLLTEETGNLQFLRQIIQSQMP